MPRRLNKPLTLHLRSGGLRHFVVSVIDIVGPGPNTRVDLAWGTSRLPLRGPTDFPEPHKDPQGTRTASLVRSQIGRRSIRKEWDNPYWVAGLFKWGHYSVLKDTMREMKDGSFNFRMQPVDYHQKYVQWACCSGKALPLLAGIGGAARNRSRSR